ncbi:MAG: hypothetical protein H6839_17920 [Planctomycetes bacterium]|nr:hypothetical protein [Planctomycetota bacterium]
MQHPEEHDITALAYGLIEGAERETLLTHLSQCDDCRAVYDAYRDEQSVVRDAIVRDARSGAAEAKALESTLRTLGAIDAVETAAESEPKRGRLLSLPVWLIVGEIAAVLIVAVGLFLLLKPGDDTPAGPDNPNNPVARNKAPADIEDGVVYVQDDAGKWKPSEDMPMDEWMMVADSRPLTFTLADGSKAQLEKDAVFRIGVDAGQPVVYMLRGNGRIDASKLSSELLVRAGDAGFSAAPGAKIRLECAFDGDFDASTVRSWSRPKQVKAEVVSGGMVMRPELQGLYFVPLRDGESVEWKRGDCRIFQADGTELGLPLQAMMWTESLDSNVDPGKFPEFQILLHKEMKQMEPRLRDFQKRLEAAKNEHPRYEKDIEKQMTELEDFIKSLQIEIVVDGNKVNDTTIIVLDGETMTVNSDGTTITVTIADEAGSVVYKANSVEAVRSRLPDRLREHFDAIKFERDPEGLLRMSHAGVQSAEGMKVRVIKKSESSDSDD